MTTLQDSQVVIVREDRLALASYLQQMMDLRDEASGGLAGIDAAVEQTAEDRVATGEDRTQTGLDAVATAADRVAVAADRVQTAADAVATGADRVQTGLDALSAANDRVQTGNDVLATAGDALATAADRDQTTEDAAATAGDVIVSSANRVQTGLDSIKTAQDAEDTAADRIQTGLDRIQTSADVITTAASRDAAIDSAALAVARTDQALSELVVSAALLVETQTLVLGIVNAVDDSTAQAGLATDAADRALVSLAATSVLLNDTQATILDAVTAVDAIDADAAVASDAAQLAVSQAQVAVAQASIALGAAADAADRSGTATAAADSALSSLATATILLEDTQEAIIGIADAVTTTSTQAGIATTQAGLASGSAITATTQAQNATVQAGLAGDQAQIATDQAAIASGAAQTATVQAGLAESSAQDSQSQVGLATTQAGIATTQAGIATTQAGLTAADVLLTAADRVQTGLDVIKTAHDAEITSADRNQSDLDAIATAADRVATGLDAAATANDLIQTNLDMLATAGDRVQTGLDVIATAADRVQTGLDVIATGADRVQTGLDAIATAADRVQTGLDAVSSAASAGAYPGVQEAVASIGADMIATQAMVMQSLPGGFLLGTAAYTQAADYATAAQGITANAAQQALIDQRVFGFIPSGPIPTISWDEGTWTLTLTAVGDWGYYRNSVRHTVTGSKSIALPGSPPLAGMWWVRIAANDGTLSASQTPWTLGPADSDVMVCSVEIDDTKTPKSLVYPEMHSADMNRGMHRYEHLTTGPKLVSGGVVSGYTLAGNTTAANTFGVSEAYYLDETFGLTVPELVDDNGATAQYLIRSRLSGAFTWALSLAPYLYTASGFINWDNAGTLTEAASGRYINTYLLATQAGWQIVTGQASHTSLTNAQAETFQSLNLTGFQLADYIAVAQCTWRTGTAYAALGKCRLEAFSRIVVSSITVGTSTGLPGPHASTHEASGSDPLTGYAATDANLADFTSGAAISGQVPTADGAGGVAWSTPSGAGGTTEAIYYQEATGNITIDWNNAPVQFVSVNPAGASIQITLPADPGAISQTGALFVKNNTGKAHTWAASPAIRFVSESNVDIAPTPAIDNFYTRYACQWMDNNGGTGAWWITAHKDASSDEWDANYQNVSLLLHCDGTDGSTTFTDSSPTPKTVTANGNAHVETDQAKFGTAAAYFDGTGDYLSLTGVSFGTGDFTVEGWIRITTPSSNFTILDTRNADYTDNGFVLYVRSTTKLAFGRGNPFVATEGTTSVSANTWQHFALTRASGTVRGYLDGVKGFEVTDTKTFSLTGWKIGQSWDSGSTQSAGYIDDFRITIGYARYTGDSFTPPIAAFQNQ